ncbi:hypothetical protein P8452_35892 [Trifolium repens]|nr:hypothetical protein P8452_35892 [Trifolium repens]
MCHMGDGADSTGGPEKGEELLGENRTRFALSEPVIQSTQTRSVSLPPNRPVGPSSPLGRGNKDELDFSDTISLIEVRRGAEGVLQESITSSHEIESKVVGRRGRSRKPKDKSKFPKNSKVGMPKFLQFEEAMKEGGGRVRKKKQDVVVKEICDREKDNNRGIATRTEEEEELVSSAPALLQEVFLEVVLPAIQTTPASGLNLLQQGDLDEGFHNGTLAPESKKLLQIQQKVGFCYKETDEEVVKVLESDEQRDRQKKQDWEQKNGFQ